MDLGTILAELAVASGAHADQLADALDRSESADESIAGGTLWRTVALLRETAGITATLAATGPMVAPEGHGTGEALSEAHGGSQGVSGVPGYARGYEAATDDARARLADLLGYNRDACTFDELLERVDEHMIAARSAGRLDADLRAFATRIADASGGLATSVGDHDALVERVRVQREERGAMLAALRRHLGRAETQTDVADLVEMLVARQSLVAEQAQAVQVDLDALRDGLRFALGDLPRGTTDTQLVDLVRSMREDVGRLRKGHQAHESATRAAFASVRTELINVAKVLGTYAPGMDDMPDDELRTTVHTIASMLLTDHRARTRQWEQLRSQLGDIAESLDLGRGADADVILRRIRAWGEREWASWADELADVLGMGAPDDQADGVDLEWTDEAMQLIVDKVRQLLDERRELSGHREDLARALSGTAGVDFSSVPWPGLIGHVRALAQRENGRPSGPVPAARAVGPVEARQVPAGPSVDTYGVHLPDERATTSPTAEIPPVTPSTSAPTNGWSGVNRGEPA